MLPIGNRQSNLRNSLGLVICHVTTAHLPFDGRIFHKECRSLAKAGYRVHLVAPHECDEFVQGTNIHALPKAPNRLVRMLFWPLLAYHKVLSIRPRPVICHLHDPELLPVGMALRLKGFKVIYDVHENVADQILHKHYLPLLLRRPISLAYRFAEGILTSGMATVHVMDSIARHYRWPRVVIRNLPRLSVAGGIRPPKKRYRNRLIYVGDIAKIRGAMTMIQVADELNRRGVDFELRLVGGINDEDLEREMRDTIRQKGLLDRVALVGQVPFEQAQEEVAAADIGLCLLHPVQNYLNSLATKVFEYMGFGVPVVASNFDCWREYVTDTGAGIQVDVMRVDEIADKIQWLLEHPDQMRRMGDAGRYAVETKYCWEKEEERLIRFYRKIIGSSR